PNFGGATVYTTTRAGYARQCPNLGRLLRNLQFTATGESQVMAAMLERHEQPEVAASEWLRSHSQVAAAWLTGVYRVDGRPALTTAVAGGGNTPPFERWMT